MTDDLIIEGYASRFGERDLGGDIVRPGAFAASLLTRTVPFPMLYAHDTDTPIGVWTRVVEDETGLFVRGTLQGGSSQSDRAAALVQSGAVSGLSIGYRTLRARETAQGRELLDIELWEISLVAFPMLPSARILRADAPSMPAMAQPSPASTPTTQQERIAA